MQPSTTPNPTPYPTSSIPRPTFVTSLPLSRRLTLHAHTSPLSHLASHKPPRSTRTILTSCKPRPSEHESRISAKPLWPPSIPPFLKVSAVSLALLASSCLSPSMNSAARSAASRAEGNAVTRRWNEGGGSDVEAAAMTLGAVTVGGLIMRVIIASRRDEKKERERVARECKRLEEEEVERMKRRERKKMESVGEVEDTGLMEELRRRMENLGSSEEGEGEGEGEKGVEEGEKKEGWGGQGGVGSAILERGDESGNDGEGNNVDFLNRMWKLSQKEEEEEKRKKGEEGGKSNKDKNKRGGK